MELTGKEQNVGSWGMGDRNNIDKIGRGLDLEVRQVLARDEEDFPEQSLLDNCGSIPMFQQERRGLCKSVDQLYHNILYFLYTDSGIPPRKNLLTNTHSLIHSLQSMTSYSPINAMLHGTRGLTRSLIHSLNHFLYACHVTPPKKNSFTHSLTD